MIDTNTVPVNAVADLPSTLQLHWPALVAIAGWITHANWHNILHGFSVVQNYCDARQGGVLTGLFRGLFGKPTIKSTTLEHPLSI